MKKQERLCFTLLATANMWKMYLFVSGVKGQDKKGKDIMYEYEDAINESISLSFQRSPCLHTITLFATSLKLAQSKEFEEYQERLLIIVNHL